MKKVIFVCLLTLSVCLSAPAGEQGTPEKPAINASSYEAKPAGLNQTATINTNTQSSGQNVTGPVAGTIQTASTVNASSSQNDSTSQNNSTSQNDSTSLPNSTTNDSAKPDILENTTGNVNNTSGNNQDVHNNTSINGQDGNTAVPKNDLQIMDGKSANGTEKSSENSKTDGDKPTNQAARGFDGGSFIGGIILTLGLLAIGFMGFKYYKNQTERNYHTL